MIKCKICLKECKNINGLKNHMWRSHTKDGKNFKPFLGKKPWNKGLNKENNLKVKKYSETLSKRIKEGLVNHHSGRASTKEKEIERRKKISESMKKAHKEGRANNWQDSKKFNNKSYPEIFFEEVINNEFEDKNYVYGLRFYQFALDFAWPDKKLVIEIDGEQHQRLTKQKENDELKNKLLLQYGWKFLRIKWIDMFHDTKKWIKKAKDFIDN